MRIQTLFAIPALAVVLSSCSSELPPGGDPGTTVATPTPAPRLGTFALKASNGSYVSCIPDSSGQFILLANKPVVGPTEVFTAWYGDDGRMGFKAANGKYVCADRAKESTLVADRDAVGEWESFELVEMGGGLFALKNSNGRFVCARYDLPGNLSSILVADREVANEWERFTVVQDPIVAN